MGIMAPSGTLSPVSVSEENLIIPYMPILLNSLRIQGGITCARKLDRDWGHARFRGLTRD
ncbi:hypothetical protein V1517DRAFT_316156 [Lipomyces orientalis]|uniref:Uncharacterized protein n=1 Tax=Lipomyces orientalis TaxID=1233043 RepID=A0ACC3TW32_9ASCO